VAPEEAIPIFVGSLTLASKLKKEFVRVDEAAAVLEKCISGFQSY
jgi:hypothetical protein